MKTVFTFRNDIIEDYQRFSRSFTKIAASDIKTYIDREGGAIGLSRFSSSIRTTKRRRPYRSL